MASLGLLCTELCWMWVEADISKVPCIGSLSHYLHSMKTDMVD